MRALILLLGAIASAAAFNKVADLGVMIPGAALVGLAVFLLSVWLAESVSPGRALLGLMLAVFAVGCWGLFMSAGLEIDDAIYYAGVLVLGLTIACFGITLGLCGKGAQR